MASISQTAEQVASTSLAAPVLLLVDGTATAELVRAALLGASEGFRLLQVTDVSEASPAGELPMCALLTLRPGDPTAMEQVRSLHASGPSVPRFLPKPGGR